MQSNSIDSSSPVVRRRFPPVADRAEATVPPRPPACADSVLDRLPAVEPSGDSGMCEWFASCLGYESAYRHEINEQYEALLAQCASMPAVVPRAPGLQARLNRLVGDLTELKHAYVEIDERPRFMGLVLTLQHTATRLAEAVAAHVEKERLLALLPQHPNEYRTATNPAAVWSPPPLPDVVPQPTGVKAPKRHMLPDRARQAAPRVHSADAATGAGFVLTPAHEARLRAAIDLALERENGRMLLTDRDTIALGQAVAAVVGGRFPATSNDPRLRRNTPESTIAAATDRMTGQHREVVRAFADAHLAVRRAE